MKKLAITTAALAVSASTAFADNHDGDVVVNGEYDWPSRTESGERYTGYNSIMMITVPEGNTNGEDLKCLIYDGNRAGGASCNWTAPAPQ